MGQAANLGLTIGVLTGVGAHRDLVDADIIVQVSSLKNDNTLMKIMEEICFRM